MRSLDDFKREVAEHYTGPSMEVTVDRDPTVNSTGNGISYRSLFSILCCLNDAQDQQVLDAFRSCMRLREAAGPGLYHRNPGDTTNNGVDDYVYGMAASCLLEKDRSVSRAMLNHARHFRWRFDDQVPASGDVKYWFGRYPWFTGMLQIAAGEGADWLHGLALTGCNLSPFLPSKDDAGGCLMAWTIARIAYLSGGVCGTVAHHAMAMLEAAYPGGMADAAAAYFNRKGEPEHPLSWPEVWHDVG